MKPRKLSHLSPVAHACLVILVALASSSVLHAEPAGAVVLRDDFSSIHRAELTRELRAITGLSTLDFDSAGFLRLNATAPVAGSETARELLSRAANGENVIVLEEASRRADVVFCRVIPGKWTKDATKRPAAYVLQIDFADFRQLVGDRTAQQSFNVAWGVLHELDHVVNDLPDADYLGDAGPCEDHINTMRRELGLPERVEYFFTLFPMSGDEFKSRVVRLAFEKRSKAGDKSKRYWLVWDANAVGLIYPKQIASAR